MANSYFKFRQFTVHQDLCAMKVTTDACLFGAWAASNTAAATRGELRVLDAGAGTGLLSFMMAQQTNAEIDMVEIDPDAFEQANENTRLSPWASRIRVINEDVKTIQFPHKYDVIISNPPFYENELKGPDEKKNIAHHSERLLLSELLTVIKENLSAEGLFYLLLPYKRHDGLKELLLKKDLAILELVFVRQSVKHDYFRIILKGNLGAEKQPDTALDEISIWDDKQQYTPEFVAQLKDYYLNL